MKIRVDSCLRSFVKKGPPIKIVFAILPTNDYRFAVSNSVHIMKYFTDVYLSYVREL